MLRNLSYKNFSFGYTFEENKEIISLIFINYFQCILFCLVVVMLHSGDEELLPVTYRYHGIVLMTILNMVLIRFQLPKIARLNLLITFPFLIMLLPHIAGIRDNEFYFWMPYVPIGLSLIAQFTFHPRKDKLWLFLFLVLYLFFGLLIDNIMIFFSDGSEQIIPLVEANRFYYNLIPVFIFIFVNLGIGLILTQNESYERRLQNDRLNLEEANNNLSVQKQKLIDKNRDLDRTLNQLFDTRDRLIQSEKLAALGTLTAGIAHEINNPLNFISASLEEMDTILKKHPNLFEDSAEKEKYEQYFKLMNFAEEGVKRVTEIVTKLGMLKTRKNQTAQLMKISALIDGVMLEMQEMIPSFIEVISEIPDKLSITCDTKEIQQVLQNILSNAVDAISEKENRQDEQINIKAGEETIEKIKYACISISNTGPPIPENELHHIFDPFYTTKSQGNGVGLGLSVSFNTVQQHKGILSAKNLNNQVVFKICLPII